MTLDARRAAARDALADLILSLHAELTPPANWPAAELIWDAASEVVNGTREEITAAAAVFEHMGDGVLIAR